MSNKVIKMPKRKTKNKVPFTKLTEAATEISKGDSPDLVKDRGYSLLQIAVRIVGTRAIDMGNDVSLILDGKPLRGVGRIELSANPPHFEITIVDEKLFQDSINKAGFFYAHGFTISKLLLERGYPALKCAECAEKNRVGWLRLELSGMCDNVDCQYASPIVKAKKIQETIQPIQKEDNSDVPPPVV